MGVTLPCCGYCEEGGRRRVTQAQRQTRKNTREDLAECYEQVKAFRVMLGAPLFVAECHANIIDALRYLRPQLYRIYDYDAHFDREHVDRYDWSFDPQTGRSVHVRVKDFNRLPLHCANWIWYAQAAGHHIHSRMCCATSLRSRLSFPAVFLCLSSPWTPAGSDPLFFALIDHLREKTGTRPRFIGHRRHLLQRQWRRYRDANVTAGQASQYRPRNQNAFARLT